MENENIADIFGDEKEKKISKNERKLNKIKKKQDKLVSKEQKSNEFYNVDEIKVKKIDSENIKNNKIKIKKSNSSYKLSVIDFLYDTLFGFVTILLFLTSIGYLGYSYYKNNEASNIIIGGLLVATGLFYMLSMFCKDERFKKVYAILTSLSLMGFMALELFMI